MLRFAHASVYFLSLLLLPLLLPHTLHYTIPSFSLFVKIVFEWNQELVVSACFKFLTPVGARPNVPDNVPTSTETLVHPRFLLVG